MMHVGAQNLITDVDGILVGNAQCQQLKSGVSVLSADAPFIAGVSVMGGAPGTRETDCLQPENLVDQVDALVLSGGSAFGLDAASGVADALARQNKGYQVGSVSVPIVPAAILFDLLNGGDKQWPSNPYKALGEQAFNHLTKEFALGSVGAGTGATTATLKGGLGSASIVLPNGYTVGALVAVNPHGSAVVDDGPNFWAAPYEVGNEYGGLGVASPSNSLAMPVSHKRAAFEAKSNTTIAIVATDAVLTKAQAKRFAVAAHDGMARALYPSHTLLDGDLVFGVSTARKALASDIPDLLVLGHAASLCLARAIARGVFHATEHNGDILPCWRSQHLASN